MKSFHYILFIFEIQTNSLSFFQFLQGLGDDRALLCDRAPPEALFRKAIPPGHTDPIVRAVQHSKVLRAGETGD